MGTLAHVASTGVSLDYTTMKLLGYDAITFGNHDFELGPGFLAKTLATALSGGKLFPIVASNIHFTGDPTQPDASLAAYMDETGKDHTNKLIRRWHVITTSNGIRVGLVGVMGVNASHYAPGKTPIQFSCTPAEEQSQNPEVQKACLEKLYLDTQKVVDELRDKQKVDIVIVMIHGGTDSATPSKGESYKLAENVSGIDLVLSGHTHLLVPYQAATNRKTGKVVHIIEPGAYGEYVAKIALTVDSSGNVSYNAANSLMVPITNAIGADPAMQGIVDKTINYLEMVEDVPGKNSFLKRSLSEILGAPVNYNGILGSLYFYTLGKTSFNVAHECCKAKETPILRLVADSFKAEAGM